MRRVSLTETGQRVRDQLREPHAHLESALSMVLATAHQPRGRIVVTAPADFAATVLTGALARFVRRHPHVTVDVRATAQMLDPVGSGIDAAIRIARRRLDDSTVRASKLCELKAGLYAASTYVEARGTPRTPDEAMSHPWVAFSALRDLDVHGPDGAAHLRPEPRITSDDMMVVLNAVLQGSGIAALPRFVVDEHVRHGRLVELLPRWTIQGGHLWFLTPPAGKGTSLVLRALRECIVEVLDAKNFRTSRAA